MFYISYIDKNIDEGFPVKIFDTPKELAEFILSTEYEIKSIWNR